jgi:hypothetical protein
MHSVRRPHYSKEGVARLVESGIKSSTYSYAAHISSSLEERANYIAEQRSEALSARVDPEQVNLVVDDFHASAVGLAPGVYVVWKVIECDGDVVFFDPESGQFGLAAFLDGSHTDLVDLGLRTNDPFEAFLA